MAFEGISARLQTVFKKLSGRGKLSEKDVRDAMREIRLALLEADVNFLVAKDFVKTVTERAVGAEVLESLTPGQQVGKIVNEELTRLMGGGSARLEFGSATPAVFLLAGLQGAGKTTLCGKLAVLLKKQYGKTPMLAACDVYRPAAIEQLKVVGAQAGVPVFERGQADPVETAQLAVEKARHDFCDVLIVDTAGRLHIDADMMVELGRIRSAVNPSEVLLVVDAMTGQDAVNAATAFDEALDITGVMLTKLDGDARGGAALSVTAVTGKPIKFAGIGEKLDQIEAFHPDRMAGRILGMGDVLTLIEKAEQNLDEKKAAEMADKLRQNKFTLADYLEQMKQLKGMGSMEDIAGMLGMNAKSLKGAKVDEKAMARTEAIILSMTPKERENPGILGNSRKKRIAAGSGTSVVEVNRLLKQYDMMLQLVKQMSGNSRKMKKFAKMGGMPGMPGMGGFPGM